VGQADSVAFNRRRLLGRSRFRDFQSHPSPAGPTFPPQTTVAAPRDNPTGPVARCIHPWPPTRCRCFCSWRRRVTERPRHFAQWATRNRRPLARVELTPADNDPVHLLHHIALSLSRIRPTVAVPERGPDYARGTPHSISLCRDCSRTRLYWPAAAGVGTPTGCTYSTAALDADLVKALADSLAPGSHVVVVSRDHSTLRLGGLRSQGRCVEFGRTELAFTRDEVRAVLHTAGLHPAEHAVDDLLTSTEGWPAGVYLTALSMCDRADSRFCPRPGQRPSPVCL